MSPWVIVGRIVLAYAHSQMNLQTCTEFGANRSIRLAAFPDLNVWPPNPQKCPLWYWGRILFCYIHSQTNSHKCTKFGANRSSRLTAFPDIWICDPLNPPKMLPGVLWGDLYLVYVYSHMNPQTWTKVGANRYSRLTASQDFWLFWRISIPRWICTCVPNLVPIGPAVWQLKHTFWICDPLKPPPNAPWDIEGRIVFSLCPFPDESADVYQIWYQSVQLFDSFPRLLNLWPPKPPGVLRGEM